MPFYVAKINKKLAQIIAFVFPVKNTILAATSMTLTRPYLVKRLLNLSTREYASLYIPHHINVACGSKFTMVCAESQTCNLSHNTKERYRWSLSVVTFYPLLVGESTRTRRAHDALACNIQSVVTAIRGWVQTAGCYRLIFAPLAFSKLYQKFSTSRISLTSCTTRHVTS